MTGGNFLKFDAGSQQWYDGGTSAAKNRVGSAFRDASVPDKVKCMEAMKSRIKMTNLPSKPSRVVSFRSTEVQSQSMRSTIPFPVRSSAAQEPIKRQVSPVNLPMCIPTLNWCFEPVSIDSDDEEIGTENMQSLLQALDCNDIEGGNCSDNDTCCSNMLEEIDDSLELLEEVIELVRHRQPVA
eukprot:CAMPEP_0119014288 /NCGR_PEP_ID=MMETSP1176-20130426/9459_1 /TAXON_ID=265551 /ORGANISM="Synedropsis recta cf, Strain CCMP1620" /LENGTH=182 /DNA_ID=CAMNT_0006967443 /DNA_START=209 /DNA_END=757 /DNA_ORIENTATION=+